MYVIYKIVHAGIIFMFYVFGNASHYFSVPPSRGLRRGPDISEMFHGSVLDVFCFLVVSGSFSMLFLYLVYFEPLLKGL